MSVKNFIPTLWSDMIFRSYDKNYVFAPLANREYEGEIRGFGDKVKINEIGDVSVNTYSGTVSYEDPEDASKFLVIDQQKYAAVQLDDIDAAQVKPKIAGEVSRKMGIALGDTVDQFVAAMYSEAGLTTNLGTTDTPISITSANMIEYLGNVNQLMDESNNPQAGRVAVVPPWFVQKMTLAKVDKDTNNSATITSGYVGSMMGFDFYMSNNVVHSGTTWYAPMFFLRGNTIAFAEQLMETEALRDKESFKDYLRALMVYGGKVVRPSSLATLICAPGSESSGT